MALDLNAHLLDSRIIHLLRVTFVGIILIDLNIQYVYEFSELRTQHLHDYYIATIFPLSGGIRDNHQLRGYYQHSLSTSPNWPLMKLNDC